MTVSDPAPAGATTSNITRRVRTRYAPSPTGNPHVGNLRTALFSYLLARHYGGDFILRIEDTDQTRLKPGALESIIASLKTLGMEYDEGPDVASVAALDAEKYGAVSRDLLPENGGAHGPYFQSQRLPRYHEVVNRLLEEGKAYYAFETKQELDAMRAAAQVRGEPFLYNRRYRDLPLDEARARVAAGEEAVVRLKMPTEGPIRTVDYLRGETVWDAKTQDDFIILKADGFPPYHLAAMVDDHDMEISHVLRGEEWLPSFPKHVCLLDALGWEHPVFIHTPYVLGPDKKKLSKRTGAKPVVGVLELVNEKTKEVELIYGYVDHDGVLPEALFNYLCLVGWSPGDDREILSKAELIEAFNELERPAISRAPGIFDLEKLYWMDGVYIRSLSREELARRSLPYLVKSGLVPAEPDAATLRYAGDVIALEQERITKLSEVPEVSAFFFAELPEYEEKGVGKHLKKPGAAEYLSDVAVAYADLPDWSVAEIERVTREAGAKHGREKGDITHPVRVAVSGREVGPGLFEMIEVLGRDRSLRRIARAVEIARG
jgi:glutamyl-tRNA synthetase